MQVTNKLKGEEYIFPEPTKLMDGLYLLKMPLPFRLDHINVYLLEDDDGWNIIDCGLDVPETIDVWKYVFSSFFKEKKVKSVYVTHLHPDHIGVAYWLSKNANAQIFITRGEWELANKLMSFAAEEKDVLLKHYSRFGLNDMELEKLVTKGPVYRRLVHSLPKNVEYIGEDDSINMAGRKWEVKIGRGHSPEHACFWCESEKLLISGDHILPRITPNISLMALGLINPLNDYLTTLDEFKKLSAVHLFPSHGLPIEGVNNRIRELIEHHEENLDKLVDYCGKSRTVEDCTKFLFGKELPSHQYGFAIGETAAHLVYLQYIGRVSLLNEDVWEFISCQ